MKTKDFEKILQIGIDLTTQKDKVALLNSIVDKGMEITNCDACTLYLYRENQLSFYIMKTLSMGIDKSVDNGQLIDLPPVPLKEENVCAYAAIHRKCININNVYENDTFDFSGPKRYDDMTGYHTKSMLVIPVEDTRGKLMGVLQFINSLSDRNEVIPFEPEYEMIVRSLGSLVAVSLANLQYLDEIKEQLHSFVEAMATAIDERTPYNGTHTRKVAQYATMIASCLEDFDQQRTECLELAALLHDVGKMIIPKSVMNRATRLDGELNALEDRYKLLKAEIEILMLKDRISMKEYSRYIEELEDILNFIYRINKQGYLPDEDYERVCRIGEKYLMTEDGDKIPYLTDKELKYLTIRKGTLTDEDRIIMESHVEMTARILSKVRFNDDYRNVPLYAAQHHEYLNGTGYPNHLSGKELPVESRILTVADIYDALTANDRPYKPAMPKEKALNILDSMADEGKLDAELVAILKKLVLECGNEEKS